MCLLSYAKVDNTHVFTSNRDIDVHRPTPEKIIAHSINGQEVFFPMDYKGGSWLVHDQSSLMILLNGADKKHTAKAKYRLSRGKILIDLFSRSNSLAFWQEIDLHDVEPFTIVSFDQEYNLTELVWDEKQKYTRRLASNKNHLWLSSTLYTEQEKASLKSDYSTSIFTDQKDLLDFNRTHTYDSIKSAGNSKKPTVETTCHYQLISRNGTVSSKELILQ